MNVDYVSSPAATGGAGPFFEQHVNAYWLALLLVRGIPPILHDCTVLEVCLQTEHLGWNTDDFLIVGENGSGNRRKLAGQVKRTFTVSATDNECKKAIQDFWKDFTNPQKFSATTDRFALVIWRGTNTILEHFAGLLDCARVARNGAEFEARLTIPGFLSSTAIRYCGAIQAIISESEGKSVSAADIWLFLRVLHVLSLDLNSSTRQTEAAIKNLLAYMTSEHDPVSAADASWNALLRELGEGMPTASSYRREDLSETLRLRHGQIDSAEHQILGALRDHSKPILDGIHTTIGNDLHLSRNRLIQQTIEQMESTQVVLISGAAGSGKSAMAKDTMSLLAEDHFVFSFRAEEFAVSHIDETLQRSNIPCSSRKLSAILAGQGHKILLVESVERLLEASIRDAFTDLLSLIAEDESWLLVLTCRDYSLDLVRTGLLDTVRLKHSIVAIPPFTDEELQTVEIAFPTIARALASATLRPLFRNPYILDKALQISWEEKRSLPQSEREFRERFWQEIVRVEHCATSGMPHRRDSIFNKIALRRAQSLTLYAVCSDLDPEVVSRLQRDSLLISDPQSSVRVAPAHDILEDWAILRWIDELYVTCDGDLLALSSALGTYPSVRRTYRKWIDELVGRDLGTADRLFEDVIVDSRLPSHFRDDALVALLRSSSVAGFLERHTAKLFANDSHLLLRIIHLLRVACVVTPAWVEWATVRPSMFNVPDGPAWAYILKLVHENLHEFADKNPSFLLAFVEDWVRGATSKTPYPEGDEAAVAIVHWLLPKFDAYRNKDYRDRTLQVISKIPNSDRERFISLLRGEHEKKNDYTTEDFRHLILEGPEGVPAVRDMPNEIVSVATDYLLYSEADLKKERSYTGYQEIETFFGIKGGHLRFFPASAYQGPFLSLLRYHPSIGVDFITKVFNHSADWYAHPRMQEEYIEPPFEITLTFADKTSRSQWCNARLWNLYRGTSVGPYVLQSLLMALEKWLLEVADQRPDELDTLLLEGLRGSASAAFTSVIASVATAFPNISGETLLTLVRSPQCVLLDRQRFVNEPRMPSGLAAYMPHQDAKHKIYQSERKEADSLPHRRRDLEAAIIALQFGPLALEVQELLDQHLAELPPIAKQHEADLIWRLALHRMDLRHYAVSEFTEDASISSEDPLPNENQRHYIRIDPKPPEADIKAFVEEGAAEFHAMTSKLRLLMWGLKVFSREEPLSYSPDEWQQILRECRALDLSSEEREEYGFEQGGPEIVAAICIRDHWDEMLDDERQWCVNAVCSEVEHEAEHWDRLARVQRNSMSADRLCAWVMPLLFGKSLQETERNRAHHAFLLALTHAIDEVRWYAASGIAQHLWAIDHDLAMRCVNAIATETALAQLEHDKQRSLPYEQRRSIDEIEAAAAHIVRHRFLESEFISSSAYQEMNVNTWFGAEANTRILAMLEAVPNEALTLGAFERLAQTLVGWWDADDDRSQNRNRSRERNHDAESAQLELLYSVLLRIPSVEAAKILQPFLSALDRHPREIHGLIHGLIYREDRQPNSQQFWAIWEMFAAKIKSAEWLDRVDDEYSMGSDVIAAIFLRVHWKAEIRHWTSLEGYAEHVHMLFENLPPSLTVLDNYVRFLYNIGEQSLPEAFIQIARYIHQGTIQQMKGNTIFLMEVLLQRYVYSKPLELKRQRDLREAVLSILDILIENGSSAAFRMRDDFVTPISLA
jgi:hypothetical protein